MSEHEKASRQKQGEADQKHRVRQQESEPPFDQSYGWEQGADSISETPFRPRMDEHSALLAAAHSDESRANLVLRLQQTYGNRYVQRLLGSLKVQSRLTVSAPNDVCEQEADRVAKAVTRSAFSPAQRQAEEEEEEVQAKSVLQRQAELAIPPRLEMGGIIARTPAAGSSKGTITISRVKKTHYNVNGSNLEEVSTQLDPEEWGRCTWEWNQSYRTTEGVTDRVNISLKLTIRLPRWVGRGWRRASANEKAEWNRMLGCLQAHENRHAEIARSWVPVLQERLLNQPEGDIGTLWNDGLADHQSEQDSYDADTEHGQTEGVTLDTSLGQPAEEQAEAQVTPLLQRQAEEEEEEVQTRSVLQRQAEEEEEEVQTRSVLQRQAEEEEEEVQTKSVLQQPEEEEEVQARPDKSHPVTVPEGLEKRIEAARGNGQLLSDIVREPMERAFGADFGGVRVHTNSEADTLNQQLSAKAFTTGQDVFFREGEYSPGSGSGQELIAHELTHVVQQSGTRLKRVRGKGSVAAQRKNHDRKPPPLPPKGRRGTPPKAAPPVPPKERRGAPPKLAPPIPPKGRRGTPPKLAPPVPPPAYHDVTFNPKEIPADGKTRSQAKVNTIPPNRQAKWGFAGDAYGSKVSPAGVITPGSDIGWKEKVQIPVKATDAKVPAASSTGLLTVWNPKVRQAQADYTQFVKDSPYKWENYKKVPVAGMAKAGGGNFDVNYDPKAKNMGVTVRVKFDFRVSTLMKFLGWFKWRAYRRDYVQQVEQAWSNRYTFKNIREPQSIWGKLAPTTVSVNVKEVKANQHFIVEVHPNEEETANVVNGVVQLFKGDNVPKEFETASAKVGEIKHLKAIAKDVAFAADRTFIPIKSQPNLEFLATYLKRINTPEFTIKIKGHSDNADKSDLSAKRAQAVKSVLERYGLQNKLVQHELVPTGEGKTGARKVEFAPEISDKWKNIQPVIPHEFGHMIGLDDEYDYNKGVVFKSDHYKLVKEAFGQKYADRVAKMSANDKAAIMDGGKDLRIYHYVTFWDALCNTTAEKAAVPANKFGHADWKFIG